MPIEQALYDPAAGPLARSPGFLDAWQADAAALCRGFGERPPGVACPLAIFARPFGRRHVAVVRAADQENGGLAFHLLILPRDLYAVLAADVFRVCDAFPVDWSARGELPALEWTAGPPPRRTVDQVRGVLDTVAERTQTLLGGVQVLIDGRRLVFARKEPDPSVVRDLWMLLPDASRAELWPATFAFGNALGFSVVVTPDDTKPEFAGYVREADAGDYPEGRYEFALHHAADHSDQAAIDALFARRSRGQVLRMAVLLLVAMLVIPTVVLMTPGCPGGDAPPRKEKPRD